MHARVAGQLGMEGRDQEASLPQEHGDAVVAREHLDVAAGIGDARCADEHSPHRLCVVAEVEIGLEAGELAAIAVALHVDVHEPEMRTVEQDHPRAGAEDRRGEAPDRLLEPVEPHQAGDRRRLPARDHEPVEARRAAPAGAPRRRPRRARAASPRARGNCPARQGHRSSCSDCRSRSRGNRRRAASAAAAACRAARTRRRGRRRSATPARPRALRRCPARARSGGWPRPCPARRRSAS